MNSIRNPFLAWIFVLTIIGLSACGGAPDPDDPDSMAREKVPEHNTEATHRGRTALQYADQLHEGHLMAQLNALSALQEMGVDALPARQAVRAIVEDIDSFELEPRVAEELEVNALGALAAMQAPEAPAMIRLRIIDPNFSERPGTYARLVRGVGQMDIEPGVLATDVTSLAASWPDHALRLLQTDALPDQARESLGRALFDADHKAGARAYFLENLAEFESIDDAETLAYIGKHIEPARENLRATQDVLVAVGTEQALELALAINESTVADEAHLVSRFARSKLGPERAMALMLEAVVVAESPREISDNISAMAIIPRDLAHAAKDEQTEILPVAAVHELHTGALARLIAEGPTADHQAAGMEHLTRHVQRNQDVPVNPTLDPVFAIARHPETTFETRLAAQHALHRVLAIVAGRDPEYIYGETVALLWAGTDALTTEVPQAMLIQARRSPEHAAFVIEKLDQSLADHMDNWTVNPAAAVALNLAGLRQFDRRPPREQGSIVVGRLIASPRAELAFLEPHLRRHVKALAAFDKNTSPGMIGLLGPSIFAEHEALHRQFEAEAFAGVMAQQPGWFRDEPEAVAEWRQFLQQVSATDRQHFSPAARSALADL